MSATSKDVAQHYEKYPYPTYPLHAFGRWRDLSRVDLRSWGVNTPHPKLWISGCGTISPLMFGRRNPSAEILASDLSSYINGQVLPVDGGMLQGVKSDE